MLMDGCLKKSFGNKNLIIYCRGNPLWLPFVVALCGCPLWLPFVVALCGCPRRASPFTKLMLRSLIW
ncbi:MAG: hypothetical protein DRR19_26950 [Candidatus Parabeggiatoa sp. nov. 1]|nr:MAG: hypothetical protein DRR19_26950 [Gammaproteobacteria bacterium]